MTWELDIPVFQLCCFTSCVTLDILASGFLVHVMINNSMKIEPSNGKGTGHILSAKELQI